MLEDFFMLPIEHSHEILSELRKRTDEVILMYSGGKDSIVVCDLLKKYNFKRVVCCFMYVIKDFDHMKPRLDFPKSLGFELLLLPHWRVCEYYRLGYMRLAPDPTIRRFTQKKIEDVARKQTGIDWVIKGYKIKDSMVRRYIIKRCENQGLYNEHKLCFPLALWDKKSALAYIKQHKLVVPEAYGAGKGISAGFNVIPSHVRYLYEHYPADYQRVIKEFPLAEQFIKSKHYEQ